MAAHKLGYWAPDDDDDEAHRRPSSGRRFAALEDSQRDVITHAGKAVLALGALGVVYGDIGTSPLYTEQVDLHHAPRRGASDRRRASTAWCR